MLSRGATTNLQRSNPSQSRRSQNDTYLSIHIYPRHYLLRLYHHWRIQLYQGRPRLWRIMNPQPTQAKCESVFPALLVYSWKKLALTISSKTLHFLKTAMYPVHSVGYVPTKGKNTVNPSTDFVKNFTQAIVHNLFTICSHIPRQPMVQS